MHDDHDIDQRFLKKKKKIFRPTYPNFLGHVTGNTHTFLFGLMKHPVCETMYPNGENHCLELGEGAKQSHLYPGIIFR